MPEPSTGEFILEDNNFVREESKKCLIKKTNRSKPDWDSMHFHETYEVWYLLKGETSCFIESKNYLLSSGDVLIIDKNTLHRIMMQKQEKVPQRYVLEFEEEFLRGYMREQKVAQLLKCFKKNIYYLSLNLRKQFVIEDLFFELLKEGKEQKEDFCINMFFLIGKLLVLLNRTVESSYPTSERDFSEEEIDLNIKAPDQTQKSILKIIQYVNRNYTEDLDLKLVSQKVPMSKYHFCRKFKEVSGFTFVEYLNNYRIKQAQRILKNSDIDVTDIAIKVGYNSISQFYKMFKKITGTSPLKYRKKYRQ